MSHASRNRLYVVVAALGLVLLASSPLVAQQTTTFYLDNAGSGANLGGVYTSPYNGQVNYPTSAIVPVICDDFSDESFVPEEWTAFVTPLSGLVAGTDSYTGDLKWSGSADGTLNQVQGYEAAALLSIDILNTTGVTQEEYSFALWELFDPKAFTTLTADYGVGNSYESAAQGFLNSAEYDASHSTINGGSLSSYLSNYNVTIYSYDPAGGTSCGGGYCPPPPQEFITVPEASTPVLMAVDLFGFMALVAFLRKRFSPSI